MARFVRNPEGWKKFEDKIDTGVEAVVDRGFEVSQDLVPKNEEILANSGFTYLDKAKHIFYYGYRAPYAPYLEFGTRPHYPPLEPIERWVWLKRGELKSKFGKKKGENDKAWAKRVAGIIAWKIFQNGTDPQPYMRPSMQVIKTEALGIISGEFK